MSSEERTFRVPDWPYWITLDGQIFNENGKQLKPTLSTGGYLRVSLYNRGKKKIFLVHHLVLLAFVGPRPQGMETRHLDGDPKNNHISNLRYGTSSTNKLDMVRHGRHHVARRTKCKYGHEYTEENTYYYVDKRSGRTTKRRICRICPFDEWKDLIALLPELLELEAWEYAA